MQESSAHAKLVDSIKRWISEQTLDQNMLCMYCDCSSSIGSDKPPRIEGFVPDIYVKALDRELVIVGEAKTAHDMETRHSTAQFEAFLRHCASATNSLLVIAVPWDMVNCARSLIRYLKKKTNTETVRVFFLEKLHVHKYW